jgi:hypothetical protein
MYDGGILMEIVHIQTIVQKEGEIHLTGLPFKKGERVDLTVTLPKHPITARQLLRSGLLGLWAERMDIGDSTVFARHLREQAQQRQQE